MTVLPFRQVDVFTRVPFQGNPVAVVLDADDLTTARMQAIAGWTNLSETTFVCRPSSPEADYRLRIFSPRRELPFAGHPTIGSAHAVLEHGLKPREGDRLVQECAKGLVTIRLEGERRFLALPAPAIRVPDAAQCAQVAAALGVRPAELQRAAVVDVGPVWFTVQLASGARVVALEPDLAAVAALSTPGLTGVVAFGLYGPGAAADLEVRAFAPAHGVPEDPVCGSGNGCVAALVRRDGLLGRASYAASQGCRLGRDGRVEVRFDADGTIWLGGHAVTCVAGALRTAAPLAEEGPR
jgi:PhzF family phenazine biosynthesis protein